MCRLPHLVASISVFLFQFALTCHAGSGGPDSFGYSWIDSDEAAGPAYSWIDISGGGQVLLDDPAQNGARLDLEEPVIFYGEKEQDWYVSKNGYLSGSSTDGGGDTSNDCNLPAAVSSGDGARVYVLHDNLELDATNGKIRYKYFRNSPHPHRDCGVHVVTWENVYHDAIGTRFDFQVLLFDNFDILMQFPHDPNGGAASTSGIQNKLADSGAVGAAGVQFSCNSAGSISDELAVLFRPPAKTVTRADDALIGGGGVPFQGAVGTLRDAIENAPDGWRVAFDPSISGQRIAIDQAAGPIVQGSGDIAVDASGLASRPELFGNGGPILELTGSGYAALFGLDFFGGEGADGFSAGAMKVGKDALVCGCDFENNIISINAHPREGGAIFLREGRLVVRECEFEDNDGGSRGGAITIGAVASERSLVAQDCTFNRNTAGEGGAVAYTTEFVPDATPPGELTFEACTFSANESVREGGGIYLYEPRCPVTIDDCLLIGNTGAWGGGGAWVRNAELLSVRDSAFTSNGVDLGRYWGAGLYVEDGALVMRRCAFQFNDAREGGALYMSLVDSADLRSCSFWANGAEWGSAIFQRAGSTAMANCTVTGNDPDKDQLTAEMAVFLEDIFNSEPATLDAVGCTFADNSGKPLGGFGFDTTITIGFCLFSGNGSAPGVEVSLGGNLCDTSIQGTSNPSDLTFTNAMLSGLRFTDGGRPIHVPEAGSPAVDVAAAPADAPLFDARGKARVADGDADGSVLMDAGACELAGALTVTTAIDELNGVNGGAGVSLREAIDEIDEGGVVTFDAGLAGSTINLGTGQASALAISKDLDIDASALLAPVRVSGGGTVPVFEVDGSTVNLTGLWAIDGDSSSGGAGLRLTDSAEVTFTDGRVLRCVTGSTGGGIYVGDGGALRLLDSKVVNCRTRSAAGAPGGGIYVTEGATAILRRSTIANNYTLGSAAGGGIFAAPDSNLSMFRCTISGNEAGGDGGGLHLDADASLTMENCTVSTNSAGDQGGAMYLKSAPATITSSTIVSNRSELASGGIYTTGIGGDATRLGHTILAANRRASGLENLNLTARDDVVSLGYNLIDSDELQNALASDLTERKAFLAPLANYGGADLRTHPPMAISPAIDAGDPSADLPPFDQRGFARSADGTRSGAARPDIGAVEAKRPRIVTTAIDEDGLQPERSLREALRLVDDGGRIVFGQALDGEAIRLATSEGGAGAQLEAHVSVQIDATRLPQGVRLNGGDAVRVLRVHEGANVALHAVSIGEGAGAADGGVGSEGQLMDGGGIATSGQLVFTHGSIRACAAPGDGGAIAVLGGEVLLENATLSGNSSDGDGGGIALLSGGRGIVRHSSLVENTAAGSGGGVWIGAGGALTSYCSAYLGNSSVAEALASAIDQLTSEGYNMNDAAGAALPAIWDGPGDVNGATQSYNPLALSDGWGGVHTYPRSSALHDAGDPAPLLLACYEQRGYSRVADGGIDIGAVEVSSRLLDSDGDDMPDWWEDLWGFDPVNPLDATLDANGNSTDNLGEYLAGANPLAISLQPNLEITSWRALADGDLELTFRSVPDRDYLIDISTDGREWGALELVVGEPGSETTVTLTPTEPTALYRVRQQ